MSDESAGLPLMEALRTFCDPQLVATHESARARLERIPPRPSWLDSSGEAREEWSARYGAAKRAARVAVSRAWQALIGDFKGLLERGDLVATGMKVPLDEHTRPIAIARDLWSELTLGFARSSAKGPGIAFVKVRVWRGRKAFGGDPAQALVAEEQVRNPVRTRTTKRRGPASLMDPIKAKMVARAESGKLRGTFSEESTYLERWAKHEFPDFPRTPKAKSIREALREEYNKLRPSYLTGI